MYLSVYLSIDNLAPGAQHWQNILELALLLAWGISALSLNTKPLARNSQFSSQFQVPWTYIIRIFVQLFQPAELLSPPFLEVWWKPRDSPRTRALCLICCLCSGSFQVAIKIRIWNNALDALLLHVLSLKTLTFYFGNLRDWTTLFRASACTVFPITNSYGVNWHKDFLSEILLALTMQ